MTSVSHEAYSRKAPKQIAGITIECIEKVSDAGTTTIEIAKLVEKHEALTIAIPVENIGSNNYKILFPDAGTPRQFISFPLVGSETFPYPVIKNSPLFNPDDSRSHIYLNLSNAVSFDKKVNLNRALFQRSIILFKKFLDTTSKLKWGNLHFLAKSDLPGDIQGDWYKDFIQKEIRKSILEAEIVVTEDGTRIKPKDAKFPIYTISKLDEFWELSKYLFGDKIPIREDVEVWKSIIEANTNDWLGADFDPTLEKLLLLIQSSGSFSSFNDTYFKNESLAFDILNKIIQFTEDENKELLNRKEKPLAVFPNQAPDSTFTEKQKLSRDIKVPKELKNVLKTVGDNWYDKLVRDEITVFERDSKLTVKITSDRLKERIEKYFVNKSPAEERALLDWTNYFKMVRKADSLYTQGDYSQALRQYSLAFKYNSGGYSVGDKYKVARAWGRVGNKDSAIFALRQEIKLGFSQLNELRKEPAFILLHGEKEWEQLLQAVRYNEQQLGKYKRLKDELAEVFILDQKYRNKYQSVIDSFGIKSQEMKNLEQKMKAGDAKNLKYVSNLLDRYGWISYNSIGI